MSRLFPPLAETLFDLARQIADLADEHSCDMSFGEHANLMEWELKLLAYGNLLTAFDRDQFLQEEIDEAFAALDSARQHSGGAA